MIKPTKRGYFVISENEDGEGDGISVEKIIDPAELTTIPIGVSEDNILELDTYEITNPEISDKKFVITIDNKGGEDDGIIVSPLASQTAEPDYDPEDGRKEVIAIVKKAIGEYVEIPEDEEELEESNETVVQSQVQESLMNEADEEDDNFDFRNPDENEDKPVNDTTDESAEDSPGDDSEETTETVEPDEEELSEVDVQENEDGSMRLTGDVKSLLAAFIGGDNVMEVIQDTGEDHAPEEPSVKIESLANRIYQKSKEKKLNKLLGS